MRRTAATSFVFLILAACSSASPAGDNGNGESSGGGGAANGGASKLDSGTLAAGDDDSTSGDDAGSVSPGNPISPGDPTGDDAGTTPPIDPPTADAGKPTPPHDAGSAAPPSADSGATGDGPPVRQQCTSKYGSALSTSHARLDGIVVAVLAPSSSSSCNEDTTHVHLQIQMNGAIYDVAANVDGLETEIDAPMIGGAWSEGWHTSDGLDYPSQLGLHSTAFTLTGISAVASEVEKQLAAANHVSVFCTGYNANGCHLVHRDGKGVDGAIVIDPLSATPHWLVFDFDTDSF